jgi:hypothetical protein
MLPINESVESSYFIYNEVLIGCCSTPSIIIRPLVAKVFHRKAKKIFAPWFLANLSWKSDEMRYKNLSPENLSDADVDSRVEMLSAKCFSSRSPWTTYLLESNTSKSELGFLDVDIDVEASKCVVTERIYSKERKVKHVLFRNVIIAAAKLILDLFVTVGFSLKHLEFVILKDLGDCNLKHHEFVRLAPFNIEETETEVRFLIEVSKLIVMTSILDEIPKSITIPRQNQMKMHLRFGEWPGPIVIPAEQVVTLPDLSLVQDGMDKIGEFLKDYFGGRF